MDFCYSYDDFAKMTSDYKRYEMISDISPKSASSPPASDVYMDTPRLPAYPSRLLQRGRYSRRRRARHLPFNRSSPRFSRQFSQPGYGSYYDAYQECCPDQCVCSGQKKRKIDMGYVPHPNFIREEDVEDYCISEHQMKILDWRMSPEYFKEQQKGVFNLNANSQMENAIAYNTADSHATPVKNSLVFSDVPNSKLKSNSSLKKEKKRNSLESALQTSDSIITNGVSRKDVEANSKPQAIEFYLLTTENTSNDTSFKTLNLLENSAVENLLNNPLNEVDIAIQNIPLDQSQNIPNSEQSFISQLENPTKITSNTDQSFVSYQANITQNTPNSDLSFVSDQANITQNTSNLDQSLISYQANITQNTPTSDQSFVSEQANMTQNTSNLDQSLISYQANITQNTPNSDQSFISNQDSQNNSSILSTLDAQGTLHFECNENANDYSFLDNLITELEQANSLEQNKITETPIKYDIQENNNQIVTYPESDSNISETNLNISDNQFASLLQQNQILTDLLAKVINSSEIIKSNKDKHAQIENDPLINAEDNSRNYDLEKNRLACEQITEPKPTSLIYNDTTNKKSSKMENDITTQTYLTDIRLDDCFRLSEKEDMLNTSKFSCLNEINNNAFSHLETSLSSITNYILDEPVLQFPNTSSEVLEKTTENVLEFSGEISAHDKEKVKTLVRKTTVRRRTSTKNKGLQNNKCCQTDRKLENRNQCYYLSCNKNIRDAETQTLDLTELNIAINLKTKMDIIDNSLQARKLRSRNKLKQNVDDPSTFSCYSAPPITSQENNNSFFKATIPAPSQPKKQTRRKRTRTKSSGKYSSRKKK